VARARNIKPGFFRNEDLVEMPFETRLLFIGLWTVADRLGRMEDRPKRIKMDIFPADDVDVDACLTQLHDGGFILRYVVGEGHYIQVLAFGKHQNPHNKEQASTIPAPDSDAVHDADTRDIPEASTEQDTDIPEASRADSLNSDSLIPDSGFSDSQAHAPATDPDPPSTPTNADVHEQRFAEFWSAYPNKTGKGAARICWQKRKPSAEMAACILDAVAAQARSERWQDQGGRFVPNPATWLNQERWDDELPPATARASPNGTHRNGDDRSWRDEYLRADDESVIDVKGKPT
jgi:hypothetical protein